MTQPHNVQHTMTAAETITDIVAAGKRERQQNNHEDALRHFKLAIEAAPTLPGPKLEAATELRELGRLDEAEAMAHEALAVAPNNVHAYNGLAFCARKRGQREQALKWFQTAIAAAPTLPGPKLEAATELRELGRLDEAEAMAHEALAVAPNNVHAYNSLAFCARKRGQREQALKWFQAAIEAAPTLPGPKQDAAVELRVLGEYDAAREMISRVLADGTRTPYALLMLGMIERAAGQREAALAAFTAAHEADPRHAGALVEMATEFRHLGQPAECDRCLSLALECDPRNIAALSRRAEQALQADDAALALALYSEAAADQPDCTEFQFGQVSALARLGRIQDALDVLRRIEEARGGSAFLRIRQISLLRQLGQYYDALHVAREATASEPFSFWLWAERTQTELFVGSDADVEACLAAMQPATPQERAHVERFKGLWAETRWLLPEAIEHYERAEAVLTQDPMIQDLLTRSRIMAMDLEGARHNLRRGRDLQAPVLQLRGESPNTSQTQFGQLLNEFTIDRELAAKLVALKDLPPTQRVTELAALVRANPDSTAPAINLLVALRQSGEMVATATEGGELIAQIIMQFWDESVIPEEVRELMDSWGAQNPGHDHQIFDDARAQAWLEKHYPPQVLLAYRRSREAAQKSDIFRLAWLALLGGVYADADDRCLRPLATILPAGARLVLSQEVLGTVGNNFIAVVPRHPVIELALRLAVSAVNRGDNDGVWYTTGPALLTRALAMVLTATENIQMGGTVILSLRELFEAVAIGCAAAYKNTIRHWSNAAVARPKPPRILAARAKNIQSREENQMPEINRLSPEAPIVLLDGVATIQAAPARFGEEALKYLTQTLVDLSDSCAFAAFEGPRERDVGVILFCGFHERFRTLRLLQAVDVCCLVVQDPISPWFTGSALCRGMEHVRDKAVTRFPHVRRWLLLGQAGGGYAAMLMSRLLDNSVALAFAPHCFDDTSVKTKAMHFPPAFHPLHTTNVGPPIQDLREVFFNGPPCENARSYIISAFSEHLNPPTKWFWLDAMHWARMVDHPDITVFITADASHTVLFQNIPRYADLIGRLLGLKAFDDCEIVKLIKASVYDAKLVT